MGLVAAIGCQDKPTTGSLVVSINGLPASAQAAVRVTGPGAFTQQVPATTTLDKLPPGEYTVTVQAVSFSNALYASRTQTDSSPTRSETHTVTAGHSASVTVAYALASGSVDISVSGLPAGVAPSLVLIGQTKGISKTVLTAGIVGELPPDSYELRADTLFSTEGDRYGVANVVQTFTVTASLTPIPLSVAYAISSGTLALTVSGLPSGFTPVPVTVNGPGGFVRQTGTSATYRGLAPGSYTISAVRVNGVCPDYYTPSQTSQTASVTIGGTESATVGFTQAQVIAANLNLRIDGLHLVQVVQDYTGTTPLVAGKAAFLRVFGIANQCNFAAPKVRVTISGGAPIDLAAGEAAVRQATDQGVLVSSWNIPVLAAAVQPGMTVAAVIDPDNVVAEANESDNSTGTRAIDVRVVPTVGVRLIPVSVQGAAGDVSPQRVDQLMALSRKIHPVFAYDVDIGSTLTSSVTSAVGANDANAWGQILGELDARRMTDESTNPTGRYYAGLMKVTYNNGIAGIGYLGGKSTLNWDYLPSASEVIAHELGHNYNRAHTPCGNPSGIDPAYPTTANYSGGYIGQFGFDIADGSLKAPRQFSDVMGYCNNKWVSDFTYFYMMQWILGHPLSLPMIGSSTQASLASAEASSEPSFLVWGRIVNGQPVLEPAFELSGHAELPSATGPHRLAAVDDAGAEILSFSFAANRIADLPGDHETFAFVVPRSMLRGRALAALSLTAAGRTVTSRPAGDVESDAATLVTRVGPRAVRVQWDAAKFPAVMIRDAVTGEVLSFARGGDARIVAGNGDLELIYSNRVRSARVIKQLR